MSTTTNTSYEVRLDIVDNEPSIAIEQGAMYQTTDEEVKVFDSTGARKVKLSKPQAVTSSATVTATYLNDIVTISAQAAGLTLANPTGTFTSGQELIYRIKDNGVQRSITYGNKFRAIGVTLPTDTTADKICYLRSIYNATDDKFDVISVNTEA